MKLSLEIKQNSKRLAETFLATSHTHGTDRMLMVQTASYHPCARNEEETEQFNIPVPMAFAREL